MSIWLDPRLATLLILLAFVVVVAVAVQQGVITTQSLDFTVALVHRLLAK